MGDSAMRTVKIWLNDGTPEEVAYGTPQKVGESHWFGYQPGHALRLAIEYQAKGSVSELIDEAFMLFNINETDPRAIRYREGKNRSLSVGDVVEVDGRRFAVAMIGWIPLDTPETANA